MAHGKIYRDITETMGNTPLIWLRSVTADVPARIAVKHEGFNPYNSVKDRIGAAMVDDAIERGALRPGMVVVEPTSGNTGIGVAYAAVARGYRCIFTMPETMTIGRGHMLRALGCKVVLTEGPKGMRGAIARAEEILERIGEDRAWMPRQFDNPANPAVHYRTTGPEIWEDTDGKIDIFVSGVGTGGTITGAGRYLREKKPNIHIAAVSSGSITWAALQLAKRPENRGKLIVSIVCDFGERYLSNPVYTELSDPDFSDVEEAV